MQLHLTDLDELCKNVRNENARKYILEAVNSYRAGAYRSAIISTWIAVCVDIVEKTKELSLLGDKGAKKIEKQLKGILPTDLRAMTDFERDLLTVALDELEVITHIEKDHLERLKNDRNLCAHPTFNVDFEQFSPPAELARLYLIQSCQILLIQPPVRGREVVDRCYDLVLGGSFPSDEEKAYTVLSAEYYLGRTKDSCIRNFSIKLLKRLLIESEGVTYEDVNKVAVSLGAVSRIAPEVYNQLITSKLNGLLGRADEKNLKRIIPLLSLREGFFYSIDEASVERISEVISNMPITQFVKYRVLRSLAFFPNILDSVVDKVFDANLATEAMYKVISENACSLMVLRVIKLFVKSGSFSEAHERGNKLIIPHIEYFTYNNLEFLIAKITGNTDSIDQVINAGGMSSIFVQIYTVSKFTIREDCDELWIKLWGYIESESNSFSSLREVLEKDGII